MISGKHVPIMNIAAICSLDVNKSLQLLVVCRRLHVLFMLCVFLCVWWCPTHVMLCLYFCFSSSCVPVLPASLDCPLLIPPSVFSGVYLFIRDTLVIPGRNNILSLVPYENRCFWLNGVQCLIKCF